MQFKDIKEVVKKCNELQAKENEKQALNKAKKDALFTFSENGNKLG